MKIYYLPRLDLIGIKVKDPFTGKFMLEFGHWGKFWKEPVWSDWILIGEL